MYGNYWNYYNNPYQQPQATMPSVAFVNGVEGAKAFSVPLGGTVYLIDSDSPHLFLKTADTQGKTAIKKFLLTEVNLTEKPIAQDTAELATKKDLAELRQALEAQIKCLNDMEQITVTKLQEGASNE